MNTVHNSLVGVCIETDASLLKRQAKEAHEVWLKDGANEVKKSQYAQALKYLAKETGNKQMFDYANSLTSGED